MESIFLNKELCNVYLAELSNGYAFNMIYSNLESFQKEEFFIGGTRQKYRSLKNFLLHCEKEVMWQVLDGSSLMKPFLRYGVGADSYKLYRIEENSEDLGFIGLDSTKLIHSLKINKLMESSLKFFDDPVIVVSANFFQLDIAIFTPTYVGAVKRWNYKSYKIDLGSKQELLNRVVKGGYKLFSAEDIPDNEVFNALMNFFIIAPFSTSSVLMKDIFRSVYTDLIVEIAAHLDIKELGKGYLCVTGELACFLGNKSMLELLFLDSLGLRGMWAVCIDNRYAMLPYLDTGNLPINIIFDNFSLWVSATGSTLKCLGKEYIFGFNDISKYTLDSREVSFVLGEESFSPNPAFLFNRLILDSRSVPITYGPDFKSNRFRLLNWFSGLE